MPREFVFIPVFLCFCLLSMGQTKITHAVKVTHSPKIDGSLDEAVWQNVPAAAGFITSKPTFGQPSADSTSVKIIYDNTAIYIGAYLYCDPSKIRKQFTPRDQERLANVDHFAVFIDSYKDRQ